MAAVRVTLAVAAVVLLPLRAPAQRPNDTAAINRLIDQYGATEDAMDMIAQAKLMSGDRVWVSNGVGRRTDQAQNMRIQQVQYDALKKQAPGIQYFNEDRDRLIRFYGNGSVAVASFYRYSTFVLPPNLAPEVVKTLGTPLPPGAITLVLEKRDGEWKIVHTHVSNLSSTN